MTEDWSVYTEQFYRDHLDEEHRSAMRAIARELRKKYLPERVLDYGAGVGNLLQAFLEVGVSAIGYEPHEAWPTLHPVIPSELSHLYLWHWSPPARKYDLATCLEVAEHVPKEEETLLVERLTDSSDRVFFSSAIPGQGGTGHIHETENAHWDILFQKYDFVRRQEESRDIVRGYADEVGTLWWYRNARIYERRT